MKLYAISDLHLSYEANREALQQLPPQPDDWLIVAGDVGEKIAHLEFAFQVLCPRFRQLLWVPGNHDLWTLPEDQLRGEARYRKQVETCRQYGVLTPEDPFPTWTGEGMRCVIAPLFTLYDYTFRPDYVPADRAIDWATESGVLCADEHFLYPDPHASRQAWCEERCRLSESRLELASREHPLVIVNHFPLRRDLVHLPMVPRFSLWCGTRLTEDWHRRFRAKVVVSGHLHMRSTRWIDGVRFEEVSLGYPRHWRQERGLKAYLREILPGPTDDELRQRTPRSPNSDGQGR